MPLTFTEKYSSRKIVADAGGLPSTAEFLYNLSGEASENDARILAANSSPASYLNLVRTSITLEPVHIDTTNEDQCLWDVAVQYAVKEKPASGDPPTFSFDTTGGTQHITRSLVTMARLAAPGQASPDCGHLIGVNGDQVEGVDITVRTYSWSETYYFADEAVTAAYKAVLFNCTGTVNNASFKGFAAGEVLFLGASGSKRADGTWEINFKFAASQNKTGISVGAITGIDKKGWEYLWVRYTQQEDANAKATLPLPAAAYVEQVYSYGDLSQLGVGT